MATFVGRVISALSVGAVGSYIWIKSDKKDKQTVKRFFNTDNKSNDKPESPLNMIIKLPDNNNKDNNNINTTKLWVAGIISTTLVAIC